MTTREMYMRTLHALREGQFDEDVTELIEAYDEAISKLDAAAESRRAKSAAKQAEQAPLREAVYALLSRICVGLVHGIEHDRKFIFCR